MSTKKMQIIGLKGKSAYQYAQDGGYAGTEAEFKNKMAKELDVVYDYENLNEAILATAIKPEVSGEFIHLTDSAALPIMNFGMEGKTEQETTSGNQLIDISKIELTNTGNIDITEVGENHIVITSYDGYSGNGLIGTGKTLKELCPLLEVGETYLLTATTYSTDNTRIYVGVSWMFGKTMVMTEEALNSQVILYGHNYTTTSTIGSCKISNIQIQKGTTQLSLEPYTNGPSPNPDYPQEITNAGVLNPKTGRYEIGCKVVTENSLPNNAEEWLINYTTSWSGNAGTKPEYYAGANYSSVIIIDARPDTTMCFHNDTTDKYWVNRIIEIDNDGIGWQNNVLYYNESYNFKDYSFKTTSKTYKLIIQVRLVDNTQTFTEADLQEMKIAFGYGNSVTYTPHQSQQFTLTSPVPLTKWDKLVKRDDVWGWSIHHVYGYYDGTDSSIVLPNSVTDSKLTFIIPSLKGAEHNVIGNAFCNIARHSSWGDLEGTFAVDNTGRVFIRYTNDVMTIEDFKTKVAETPIIIYNRTKDNVEIAFHPLPESEQALLKQLETYYQVTNIFNDQNCPMSIQYVADTQTYIDNLTMSLTNAVVSLGGEV